VGGRGAHKNHRGGEELRREEWRWVSGRWLGEGARKRGFQISEKMEGFIFRREGKLSRQDKGRAKSCFSRRKTSFFMWCCSEGKEKPR
jgi:hypothetical protein